MNERAWYVVQTYSGMENAAKRNLENRVESMGMSDCIFNVLVPETKDFEKKKNGELKEIIVEGSKKARIKAKEVLDKVEETVMVYR